MDIFLNQLILPILFE